MFLFGSKYGSNSRMDGTPGDEYPRTIPIHKYDTDTHSDKTTWKKLKNNLLVADIVL